VNSKKIEIAPSILAADFRHLEREVKSAEDAGADRIHCDIMDGVFVPNISFGPMIVAAVKKCVGIPLDVHLMIAAPENYIGQFCEAGASNLTVHADACTNLSAVIDDIHRHNVHAGVAVNPDKSINIFETLLDKIDLVLIMSVYAGFGGQPFMYDTLDKVRSLATLRMKQAYGFDIEIDGGINESTAAESIKNGVNVLVSGSYIFRSGDYRKTITKLRNAGGK
jgi:ribulose-phosphate 3-epimerase